MKDNTSLQSLNLSSNRIDDDGAKEIAYALNHNTSLKSLNLRYNKIGDSRCSER